METIKLRDEFIKLGQALKAAGFVESGVDAKYAVQDGLVKVTQFLFFQLRYWTFICEYRF